MAKFSNRPQGDDQQTEFIKFNQVFQVRGNYGPIAGILKINAVGDPNGVEFTQGHTFKMIVGSLLYKAESDDAYTPYFEDFKSPIKVIEARPGGRVFKYENWKAAKEADPTLKVKAVLWGVTLDEGETIVVQFPGSCFQAVWEAMKSDLPALEIDPGTKKVLKKDIGPKAKNDLWLPTLLPIEVTPEQESMLDAAVPRLVAFFRQEIPGYLPQVETDAAPAPPETPEAPEVETEDLPFEAE